MSDTRDETRSAPLSVDERSLSIPQFCEVEAMSHATYYKMKKLRYGPAELRIPGTSVVRITPAARREWHEKMKFLAETEAVRVEAERLREHSERASAMAALSPAHVSKTGKRSGKKKVTSESGR